MFTLFGLAILATIIMLAMRRYKASNRGQNGNGPTFPGQPFGGFPGQFPGQQNNQPRDGFTQRDYYGGFGQLGAPQPPANQQYPVPYEDSPEYLNNPPQAAPPQQWQPQPPAAPATPDVPPVPPVPSGPQGYRARKLAELDQKYSNGELAMEDYMAQRAEIMKG